jgi:motility quorum-sensing regulator/GCU-specific mRNA interferase toxin
VVRALIREGKVCATNSAFAGAADLGLDLKSILRVILSLQTVDFYKSMTTHADHRVWQDVYRPITVSGGVYLKLTVVDDLLIVSFSNCEVGGVRDDVSILWFPGVGSRRS